MAASCLLRDQPPTMHQRSVTASASRLGESGASRQDCEALVTELQSAGSDRFVVCEG